MRRTTPEDGERGGGNEREGDESVRLKISMGTIIQYARWGWVG